MSIVEISALSDNFQGMVDGEKKIFIDNVIPGDIVEISQNNQLVKIVSASKDRIIPPCIHFDKCGGCSLQYIKDDKYLLYKNQIFKNAIKYLRQNVSIVGKPIAIGKFSRRRAFLKIRNNIIGYYKEQTHKIFDLKECLILDKKITDLIPKIRDLLKQNIFKPTACNITIADNGIDLIFDSQEEISVTAIEALNIFARINKILRISLNIQNNLTPVYIADVPQIIFGDFIVKLPEITFLQASKVSEQILSNLITETLKGFKNIIDLYCGIGTYSFPLANYAKVTSFEGNKTLVQAAKLSTKRNNPKFVIRDLHSNPVTLIELNKFDSAIVNPPRNGAEKQIIQLTNSEVKNIVMISCNLQSFKRDAKILIESGYQISNANLVDQFYYSKHFEIFAYFVKN